MNTAVPHMGVHVHGWTFYLDALGLESHVTICVPPSYFYSSYLSVSEQIHKEIFNRPRFGAPSLVRSIINETDLMFKYFDSSGCVGSLILASSFGTTGFMSQAMKNNKTCQIWGRGA